MARVALTAGTAAQLVVDAAALVALGADDEQTACSAHLLRFGIDGGLALGVQIIEALAGRKDVQAAQRRGRRLVRAFP